IDASSRLQFWIRWLLQVLAGPVVSEWGVGMDVPRHVRRLDGTQRGRMAGLGSSCDPAALAGGGLVEQPDGQPGVAGVVASFGLGEDGGGLAGGLGEIGRASCRERG